jgi:hypothetical protein
MNASLRFLGLGSGRLPSGGAGRPGEARVDAKPGRSESVAHATPEAVDDPPAALGDWYGLSPWLRPMS